MYTHVYIDMCFIFEFAKLDCQMVQFEMLVSQRFIYSRCVDTVSSRWTSGETAVREIFSDTSRLYLLVCMGLPTIALSLAFFR